MSDSSADHEFDLVYNGKTYSIATYNVRDDDNGSLLYDVVVRDGGGAIVLADDFVVTNPPILVPSGATEIKTDEDGNTYQADIMVEDLVAAFEQFTQQTVALRLRGLGR